MSKSNKMFWAWMASVVCSLLFSVMVWAAPAINSITPNTANNWGGYELQITGSGFVPESQVSLKQAGLPDISIDAFVESETVIKGQINLEGQALGNWDVVINNPDESNAIFPAGFILTPTPPPTVTANTPEIAENTGIIRIEISGSNFLNGARVQIFKPSSAETVDAVFVQVDSPTKLICDINVDGLETTTWHIRVINPDGQSGEINSVTLVPGTSNTWTVTGGTENFYVNAVTGNNYNDGRSATTAWRTITYALNHIIIQSGSAIVNVTAGTYNPALGESFPLAMRNNISLTGVGADSTVIDAQQTNRVIYFSNLGTGETIQRVTIKNGYTATGGGGNFRCGGAGIYCEGSSPTISECNVTGNSTIYNEYTWAGGIYCGYSSSPKIINCNITNNYTTGSAGGIGCAISSSPEIVNCVIGSNLAEWSGGGIASYSSSPRIVNCIISNNSTSLGGGVSSHMSSSPTIINCTISGNSATINSNGYGGGIRCRYASCTIVNSILWGNLALYGNSQEIYLDGGSVNITYSDIQGGRSGTGNINQNPLFVNPAAGDYHLQFGSPCINKGTITGAPQYDFEGDSRLASVGGDNQPDMGADEYRVADATPPTSTAIIGGAPGSNGWYISNAAIQISATDNESGVRDIRYRVDGGALNTITGSSASFTISTDGNHMVEYYASDNAGNYETAHTLNVKIDKTLPSSMASTGASQGSNGWYISNVEIQITASDSESGVRDIRYRLDSGSEYTVPGSQTSFTITTDGQHTITYYAADNAGNTETSHTLTVKIDKTLPTSWAIASGTQGDNSWYRSGVTVVLSATDAPSGIKEIRYSIDGGAEMTASGGSVSLTITGEGTHTVSYRASDIAGNTSANDSLTFNIDVLPPATEAAETGIMGENGWYRSDVTINLTASDVSSAVKEIRYTLNNGAEVVVPGAVATVIISAEGANSINYYSVDNAGNVENNQSRTVKVDKSNPSSGNTLSGQLGCVGWYTSNVQAQLQAADAVSGVKDLQYRLNAENEVISPVNNLTFDITTEGINNIVYAAKDNAGNLETGNSQIVKIDKTLPVSAHAITGTAGTNGWYRSGVRLELTATDTVSGVKEIHYQINGASEIVVPADHAQINLSQDGYYTITYHAVDNACLAEPTHTVNVKIDQTAPIVSAGSDIRKIETETVTISPAVTDNLDANPHVVISPLPPYLLGTTTVTVTATDAAGNVASDTLIVTVITAQQSFVDLKTEINSLSEISTVFKTSAANRKNALANKIDAVISIINAAKTETNAVSQYQLYNEAIDKLTNDIQAKMNGCKTGSSNNDWIISCAAQAQLNELINNMLVALRNLRNL